MKKSKCSFGNPNCSIENNKNQVSTHLEGIDWTTELQVNRNNAGLSSEVFLKKIEQLINLWTLLQRVSN